MTPMSLQRIDPSEGKGTVGARRRNSKGSARATEKLVHKPDLLRKVMAPPVRKKKKSGKRSPRKKGRSRRQNMRMVVGETDECRGRGRGGLTGVEGTLERVQGVKSSSREALMFKKTALSSRRSGGGGRVNTEKKRKPPAFYETGRKLRRIPGPGE